MYPDLRARGIITSFFIFEWNAFLMTGAMKKIILTLLLLYTPFVYAASIDIFDADRQGNLEAINTYVEEGGNIEVTTNEGYTPFILAAYYGNNQVLDTLVKNGADPCAVDDKGSNAFMGVAFRGHIETAKWLLKNTSCDVNHQNYAGQTALMMSSLFGHEEMIKMLLEHGADPQIEDFQGNTAASLAQGQGLTDVVEILNQN